MIKCQTSKDIIFDYSFFSTNTSNTNSIFTDSAMVIFMPFICSQTAPAVT